MSSYTREEIYGILTPIFHDLFEDDTIVLRDALTAKDVPLWDSLNHINLVISVEQRFGIRFLTAEIAHLANLGEFVDAMIKKLSR